MERMKHIVVGVAGHVDHGKTMLTAALTGVDTDRLPEEKRRGMTIVPGFAPLPLTENLHLALIDVPGHERFIKNMLAGVGGVDMALLVVAADEGVMPQTLEHLHILQLLDIRQAVAVVSKMDLVDREWLAMIMEQVRQTLAGAGLQNAPVVAASAYTGENIDQVKQALAAVALQTMEKTAAGFCRLPIDRVFSKTGFGTVVTGTLWMGRIRCGQMLQLMPGKRLVRVRGLQAYGRPVAEGVAGERVAVNLAGLEVQDIPSGSWLSEENLLSAVYRLDAALTLLADVAPLKDQERLGIHHGASQVMGRVRWLDRRQLQPGEQGLGQIQLEAPLCPLIGDRLILRRCSPPDTIGGGVVLEIAPPRHKRFDALVIEGLSAKRNWNAPKMIDDLLRQNAKPLTLEAIIRRCGLDGQETFSVLEHLMKTGRVLKLHTDQQTYYLDATIEERQKYQVVQVLEDYHRLHPLRAGMPAAELRQRLFAHYPPKTADVLLQKWQDQALLQIDGPTAIAAGFQSSPTLKQSEILERLTSLYDQAGLAPEEWGRIMQKASLAPGVAGEYLQWLVDHHRLLRCGDFYFSVSALRRGEALLRKHFPKQPFTLAQARDVLQVSRKYTLLVLESLDQRKITVRQGDARRFRE